MTVKLYEGCFVVTRGGEGDPPRAEGPITHDPSNQWPAHPFVCRGRRWSEDGTRAYDYAAGDIIAVFPTREDADAHLAGGKPANDETLGHVLRVSRDEYDAIVCTQNVQAPPATPKPVTWPDWVTEMRFGSKSSVAIDDGMISLNDGTLIFSADVVRQLAALLVAAADYVDGGAK